MKEFSARKITTA